MSYLLSWFLGKRNYNVEATKYLIDTELNYFIAWISSRFYYQLVTVAVLSNLVFDSVRTNQRYSAWGFCDGKRRFYWIVLSNFLNNYADGFYWNSLLVVKCIPKLMNEHCHCFRRQEVTYDDIQLKCLWIHQFHCRNPLTLCLSCCLCCPVPRQTLLCSYVVMDHFTCPPTEFSLHG